MSYLGSLKMTMKTEQNSEVYDEIVKSGKSLLQLYTDLKARYELDVQNSRPRADQQEHNQTENYV